MPAVRKSDKKANPSNAKAARKQPYPKPPPKTVADAASSGEDQTNSDGDKTRNFYLSEAQFAAIRSDDVWIKNRHKWFGNVDAKSIRAECQPCKTGNKLCVIPAVKILDEVNRVALLKACKDCSKQRTECAHPALRKAPVSEATKQKRTSRERQRLRKQDAESSSSSAPTSSTSSASSTKKNQQPKGPRRQAPAAPAPLDTTNLHVPQEDVENVGNDFSTTVSVSTGSPTSSRGASTPPPVAPVSNVNVTAPSKGKYIQGSPEFRPLEMLIWVAENHHSLSNERDNDGDTEMTAERNSEVGDVEMGAEDAPAPKSPGATIQWMLQPSAPPNPNLVAPPNPNLVPWGTFAVRSEGHIVVYGPPSSDASVIADVDLYRVDFVPNTETDAPDGQLDITHVFEDQPGAPRADCIATICRHFRKCWINEFGMRGFPLGDHLTACIEAYVMPAACRTWNELMLLLDLPVVDPYLHGR